jgi:chromosome segregation ATPase|eukprot:g4403.t1
MTDVEGLRLLANHLAKVKLEAAEQIYSLGTKVKQVNEENKELCGEVARLKQLCRENTLHWRLQERDDWKALVEAVQKDRSRLENDNEKLSCEISALRKQLTSLGHAPETPDDSAYVSPRRGSVASADGAGSHIVAGHSSSRPDSPSVDFLNDPQGHIQHLEGALGESKRRESVLREKLASVTAQLEQWRIEKQSELESQIGALRHKLDTELQAKWERNHDVSALTSIFSSLVETVAPHPNTVVNGKISKFVESRAAEESKENGPPSTDYEVK